MLADDTIVAVASAPGRGAVALVRLSGPRALEIAGSVVRPWPVGPREARLCSVIDRVGAVIDRPVVTVYPAPRSYTGEDVVELSTHGGVVVPACVVAALVAAGARPASPGEFTRRAVLNGKLDLAQAEAIGDLVDARSAAMVRAAMNQLDGGLSRRVLGLREAVIEVEALVAYDIDFPSEDDGPVSRERVATAAARVTADVAGLLATAPAGELVRAGAVVVIAGAPNVGKSSLFNALLGRARALVSDVPGTTRDALDAVLEVPGGRFPIRLVDTAGLRDTADVVERLGIEVSERALTEAHAVLACGETPAEIAVVGERVARHTGVPAIGVLTKCDTRHSRRDSNGGSPSGGSSLSGSLASSLDGSWLPVSAITGAGLRELLAEIERVVGQRWGSPSPETPIVTRERHRVALMRAADEVARFEAAWAGESVPAVVAAVHLRAAAGALEEIIGVVDAEDVLARVFAEFCVGK